MVVPEALKPTLVEVFGNTTSNFGGFLVCEEGTIIYATWLFELVLLFFAGGRYILRSYEAHTSQLVPPSMLPSAALSRSIKIPGASSSESLCDAGPVAGSPLFELNARDVLSVFVDVNFGPGEKSVMFKVMFCS